MWPVLAGSAIVLAVFMLWWYGAMRVPAGPSFDSAPPPGAVAPTRPSTAAIVAPDIPPAAATPAAPATRPTAPPAEIVADVPGPDGMITETAEADSRPARAPQATAEAPTPVAAPANVAAAPQRAAPARRPPPREKAKAPPPARTAQQRCADLNILRRAICESRECGRPQHANEPMCQRIRAAEDRRREL